MGGSLGPNPDMILQPGTTETLGSHMVLISGVPNLPVLIGRRSTGGV